MFFKMENCILYKLANVSAKFLRNIKKNMKSMYTKRVFLGSCSVDFQKNEDILFRSSWQKSSCNFIASAAGILGSKMLVPNIQTYKKTFLKLDIR